MTSLNWTILCPSSYLVLNWIPLNIRQSNFEKIAKDPNKVIMFSNFNGSKAISFGNNCRVKSGFRYDIDFYGEGESNVKSHYMKHLQFLNQFIKHVDGKINVMLYLPQKGKFNVQSLATFLCKELEFSAFNSKDRQLLSQSIHMWRPFGNFKSNL